MTTRYLMVIGGDDALRRAIDARITGNRGVASSSFGPAQLLFINRPTPAPHASWPMVIGSLFSRSFGQPMSALQDRPASPTPADLIARCWGSYIATWVSSSGTVQVLRDPSGALPCYYREAGGLTMVSSDLDLLDCVLPSPRRLNWPEIARILGSGDLRSPLTGLQDVAELPAGSLLTIERGRLAVEELWDPARFIATASPNSFGDDAALLRQTIDEVLSALGRAHRSSVATVSGGLDSSIVALGLGQIVSTLTCLTMATHDPSGDERRYAKLVAAAAPAAYREAFFERSEIDLVRSQARHLPRPTGRPFLQSLSHNVAQIASDTSAVIALARATDARASAGSTRGRCVIEERTVA